VAAALPARSAISFFMTLVLPDLPWTLKLSGPDA
jgi:hypothetical protein